MERYFNTAGPNRPEKEYTIDPLSRFDLEEVLSLIGQGKYFVLHAPRQSGKTSCMLALRDYLDKEGDYIAVYANVEGGQASRNDKATVVKSTIDTLTGEMRLVMKNDKADKACDAVQKMGADSMLSQFLSVLCQSLDKPLVLIIDEIDALKENRDRSVVITPEMMYRAQENLIYRRDTHIDILIDKLSEPRVRRVIEPMLANSDDADDSLIPIDDIQYVEDMGLIKRERGKPRRIANGIYREIIPRELTSSTQDSLIQQPQWYQNPDNSLNMEKLLLDFQQFFRQNADSWIGKFDYAEAGPQLLLQAFLQRIVNGGGFIDREYGLGRKRTDLLIRKPLTEGYGGPIQRVVL